MTNNSIRFVLASKIKQLAREVLVPWANPFINQLARPVEWLGQLKSMFFPNTVTSNQTAFPDLPQASRPVIAAIIDEYFIPCVRPDCGLILVNPNNYQQLLNDTRPDLLLVFSSWHGNKHAWDERVALYPKQLFGDLHRLTKWCKANGIPTVFWNIEDPVHFERFLRAAGFFDWVFTTDADCIPQYRRRLSHQRISALPFAAQPTIHNPIGQSRDYPVCFAGSYWADRYPKRQKDLETLLSPAMDFGLHIFDRHHGAIGSAAAQHRFPDQYGSAIKGTLSYDQMLSAYKKYRVFLNVNTVRDSPTMFANRVFELLACGTPVISTYGLGINEVLGDDIVAVTSSEAETRQHLERLLGDEEQWAKTACRGIRKVLSGHTYADRLKTIVDCIGCNWQGRSTAKITCLSPIMNSSKLDELQKMLLLQTRPPDAIVLLIGNEVKQNIIPSFGSSLKDIPLLILPAAIANKPDELLSTLKKNSSDWVCTVQCDHYYGPHYLEDLWLALKYSAVDVLGKHTHYRWTKNGALELADSGSEYQYIDSIQAASAMARISTLDASDLTTLLSKEVFHGVGRKCLALDRHNFVGGRLPGGERQNYFLKASKKVDC